LSRLFIRGCGAVSPAGWGMESFRQALAANLDLPSKPVPRPGSSSAMSGRTVPLPNPRPALLTHPRMRRVSSISQFAAFAAVESLGSDLAQVQQGAVKLGVILCVTSGCITYTRRFYEEVLRAPATASPLIFPETVFNASASHIAALLGTTAPAYTLLGDHGTYLTALALAADWLEEGIVDGCVVVATEELDWIRSYAMELLDRQLKVSEGAGAIYLSLTAPKKDLVEVSTITDPQLYTNFQSKSQAVRRAQAELGPLSEGTLLCDGLQGSPRTDRQEAEAWASWGGPRISPKRILGEALVASTAWQCIAVADLLQSKKYSAGVVSVAGCNEQAIMARLVASS
jgi:hypothetical protein